MGVRAATVGAWLAATAVSIGAAVPAPAEPPAPAVEPARTAPLPLDRAVEARLVTVTGARPDSYRSVDLHLTSTAKEPVTVDLAGRHLVPRSGRGQRLGLSFPSGGPPLVTPGGGLERLPGTVPLTLAPGEKRVVRMNSCCMDAGRACPSDGEVFALAGGPPPNHVETALRWWVENPAAPQGFVNCAIWEANPRLLEKPWTPDPARPSETVLPKGRDVVGYGGSAYLLEDGDLIRLDADGVRSFVGSCVFHAFPTADGLVGVGLGEGGREVWRFAPTGEPPWSRRFALSPDERGEWPEAVPAAGGVFLLHDARALRHRTADGNVTLLAGGEDGVAVDLAPVDDARSKFAVVVRRQGTKKIEGQAGGGVQGSAPKILLYDLDAVRVRLTLRKTYWNVSDMAAGPGGVFALSHVGVPERLDGDRPVHLGTPRKFERILAVGLERIVVADEAGGVHAVHARTGRVVALPIPASAVEARGARRSGIAVDPVTDDLLWVDGTEFRRLRRDAKEPETLR